ncbi:carbohydrate kinase family protein [Robertmurraya korlensis]|uniref:carbohydrate kinase family protein n=1 Tax=Robertmurraya korlensis TaxID=519977 RepID=UPI000824D6A0|nr:carbohydrate kinase [Robertmurraya korlensis]
MKKQGVISLGEAFVDFIATDRTNKTYQHLLGGATVNVAVGIKRQGIPSYYLCKLGQEEWSQFVVEELRKENVDISSSSFSETKKMCSVYIHVNEQGDRYFHSYVNETPNDWLTTEELDKKPFTKSKIFYFGSGTLFHPVARKTTDQALVYAREMNMQVAFDTNIRLKRWESEEQCRETVLSYVKKADIVKMAEDELLFLTKTENFDQGFLAISKLGIPFLFITRGKEGAVALHEKIVVSVPAMDVKVVDTTGAGDAFLAALLVEFHNYGLPKTKAQLERYTIIANNAASRSTTKFGSL